MTEIHAGWQRQAAGWQGELDDSVRRRVRNRQFEAIADAVIALVGVLLLHWSPFSLMLFLIAGLWLGLLERWLEWLFARDRLLAVMQEAQDLEELQRLIQRERDGIRHRKTWHPLPRSAGTQLAIAVFFAAAFTGSLLYQLATDTDLQLGLLLLERPDLLLVMGGLLALRLYSLQQRLRRPPERAAWVDIANPILDMLLFVILIFFWTVIGAFALKIEETVGGDRPLITATVFVCAGYLLVIWRAVGELKALRQLAIDLAWAAAPHADRNQEKPLR